MRTFNYKLFVALAAGTLLVAGLIYGVHELQTRKLGQAFLLQAKRAQESKNLKEAESFLTRYVAIAPTDARVLEELGLLQIKNRRLEQAFFTLGRCLRIEPGRIEARRELVDIAIKLDRHTDAQNNLEYLLEHSTPDARLFLLKARCHVARREFPKAVEAFEASLKLAPESLDTYLELADLHQDTMENSTAAERCLEQMVQRNPGLPLAYVRRGTRTLDRSVAKSEVELTVAKPNASGAIETSRDAASTANRDAIRALDLDPYLPEGHLLSARCQLLLGSMAEARHSCDEYLEAARKRGITPVTDIYSLLASLALAEKKPKDAAAWLRKGLEHHPNAYELRWNLAILELESGEMKKAQATAQRLAGPAYLQPLVNYFHARCEVESKRWLAAAKELEASRLTLSPWPEVQKQAEFWLGHCYEQIGNSDQQLLSFRRAVAADPLWATARLSLARTLLTLGRLEECQEQYQLASRLPQAPATILLDATRVLILVNLQRNTSERNWAVPQALLKEAETLLPDSDQVPILRAEIMVAQGQVAEAQTHLEMARDKQPDSESLWLSLAALAERNDNWDRSLEILNEAQETLGDRVRIRLTRARHILLRGDRDQAVAQIKELARPSPSFSESDQLMLDSGLAGLLLSAGDFAAAEELCIKVAVKQPSNLRVRLLLFDLAFQARKTEGMQKLLGELAAIEGTGPLWRYGSAIDCYVRGDLPGALNHLGEAALLRPAWSRIPLLRAQILSAQGKADAAITSFQEAIDLGERQATVITQAIDLLVQRERWVEVDRLIRKLEAQNTPFSDSLLLIASDVSMRLQDSDRSLKLVHELKKKGLKSIADRIFVSRILFRLKQSQEAEDILREAVQANEAAPEGWIALIQFLGQTKQLEKADAELQKAESAIEPARRMLALAQCHDSLGHVAEAEKFYQLALEERPNDPLVEYHLGDYRLRKGQIDLAEPLLERLANRDSTAVRNQAWARRNLALISANRGGLENLKIAQEELEKNLKDDPRSAPDLGAKAIVLASLGWPEARQSAIEILQGLLERGEGVGTTETGEIRFLLAKLQLAEGKWGDSSKTMQTLLGRRASESRYVAWYVDALLDRSEVSEADLWIRKLTLVAPKEAATVCFQARSAFLRKRDTDALQILLNFLEAEKSAAAPQRAVELRDVSLLLERFARQRASDTSLRAKYQAAAEQALQQYLERRPEEKLALAAFLCRTDRMEQGLEMLETHAKDARPEEIAATCAIVIGNPSARNRYGKRIESLLKAALTEKDRPVPLLLSLADLLTMQDEYDQAEKLYREVLAKTPGNLVAANNLAILLALHPQKPRQREGLEAVNRALEKIGTGPSLIDTRAIVHLAAGKPQLALEDANRAVAMQPVAGHQFHRAQAAAAVGNRELARSAWQQAKAAGLTLERLHPLERTAYKSLSAALEAP